MGIARIAAFVAVAGLASAVAPAQAALVQVASRAALTPGLTIPWTAFGPVPSALAVFQQRTVSGVQVGINSSSGSLYVDQQGNTFNGDFSAGSVLLLQPNPDDGETISFNAPVYGFGTDIDPIGFTGAFTAYMAAYDAGNNLLGIVSTTGTASNSGGGTAPFIGATSFSDPISFVTFGLVEPGNSSVSQFSLPNGLPVLGNIAIDQASVIVPEPASALVLATGTLLLAWTRRRRG